MEAAMIGTILTILTALVVAVLGCAWVGPNTADRIGGSTRQHRT
jgi:hypothetical protein